ncbi:substrate-binding domain-containing protein [Nocardioides zeae]|uniref:Substrate-binding domain-containing protein n=1 Tax=Nocardioides imazamoxiresistens TaxID=3231893 RepID=A0ABU3PR09_9ACTN|nr:substrate-binding domain-containing protein [Nocardioides zeae]MDT9591665.1 substrate-binding domain-containing protein [Nocardioides zeae]
MNRRPQPRPRRVLGALALGVLPLLATACGGAGGSASTIDGSDEEQLAEAAEINEAAQQRPTELQEQLVPIGAPVPEGKTIVSILCGLTACEELNNIFVEAADVLGWEVVTLTTTGAPESVKDAWAQAVRMEPDGVIASGHDTHLYAAELAQLVEMGIPVVQNSLSEQATEENGLLASFNNSVTTRAGGLAASFIVDHSQGSASTLYVDIPAFAVLAAVRENFEENYDELCPGCEYDTMDISITQVGKEVPNLVVSKLRANPQINYVMFPSGAASTGVAAAVRAAGLSDRVEIVTSSSGATNFAAVAAGDELAAQALGFYELMWLEADTLARHFAGVEPADLNELPMIRQTLVADNVVETEGLYPLVEDYDEQFKALWGVE